MAQMMILRRRMYSDARSRWNNLLPRKQSPGTLQSQKRKSAALSGRGKNFRGAKAGAPRIAASAKPSAATGLPGSNGMCALIPQDVLSPLVVPDVAKRRPRDRTQRQILLTQFRFQSFKKCFRMKCPTIIVPGDFKPCSPRRMFCSLECFEAHWKEKLSGNLWSTN